MPQNPTESKGDVEVVEIDDDDDDNDSNGESNGGVKRSRVEGAIDVGSAEKKMKAEG